MKTIKPDSVYRKQWFDNLFLRWGMIYSIRRTNILQTMCSLALRTIPLNFFFKSAWNRSQRQTKTYFFAKCVFSWYYLPFLPKEQVCDSARNVYQAWHLNHFFQVLRQCSPVANFCNFPIWLDSIISSAFWPPYHIIINHLHVHWFWFIRLSV